MALYKPPTAVWREEGLGCLSLLWVQKDKLWSRPCQAVWTSLIQQQSSYIVEIFGRWKAKKGGLEGVKRVATRSTGQRLIKMLESMSCTLQRLHVRTHDVNQFIKLSWQIILFSSVQKLLLSFWLNFIAHGLRSPRIIMYLGCVVSTKQLKNDITFLVRHKMYLFISVEEVSMQSLIWPI